MIVSTVWLEGLAGYKAGYFMHPACLEGIKQWKFQLVKPANYALDIEKENS